MDKIAANNHFVCLRKEVKKAKAMVSGNLIRKIGKLKQERDKLSDENDRKKVDDKIDRIYAETKLMKTLDSYPICKQATLQPDIHHWEKILNHTNSTAEQRLTARIICKNNLQKQVLKFRTDQKDCDEWLNEYIEYREKKKDIIEKTKRVKNRPKRDNDKHKLNISRPKNVDRDAKYSSKERPSHSLPEEPVKQDEELHPSWASKRKEKDLVKAALTGQLEQPKRVLLDSK